MLIFSQIIGPDRASYTDSKHPNTFNKQAVKFMHTEKPLLFEQFACHDSHLGKAIGRDEKNGYRNLAVKDPTFSCNRKMVLHDLSYIYIHIMIHYVYIYMCIYIYDPVYIYI